MGKTTFSKDAWLEVIFETISSVTFFELSSIFFVSSRTDLGVAVKTGGAWGGCLNLSGAMVEVVMGLDDVQVGVVLSGRT